MTTHYEDRCSVPGCPEPNSEEWHHCFVCGKQPIHHQHWPKLSQAGKASRIVGALCPTHHDRIDNGLWTNGVHQQDGKWYYWVLNEKGQTVQLWTPEGKVDQREIADPQFPGSIPVKRIPGGGEPVEAPVTTATPGPMAITTIKNPQGTPVFHSPRVGVPAVKEEALPDATRDVAYETTHLVLRENLPWDRWVEIGATLQRMEHCIGWWIGDWLNYGERTYGETYAQAVEATGFKIQRLMDYAWVASRIETSSRNENLSWTHHREIAPLEPAEQNEWLALAETKEMSSRELHEGLTKAGRKPAHVSYSTGENEWFTPPEYIEAARTVMGEIDLDPASCEKANEIVQANTFYSAEDDGLAQPWSGRVWMNPPYSQPLVADFAEKLVQTFAAGDVKEACVLVNNATETSWFQPMLKICKALCFIEGRVKFLNVEGESTGAPLQGQAVLYFGGNVPLFAKTFGVFGVILRRVDDAR